MPTKQIYASTSFQHKNVSSCLLLTVGSYIIAHDDAAVLIMIHDCCCARWCCGLRTASWARSPLYYYEIPSIILHNCHGSFSASAVEDIIVDLFFVEWSTISRLIMECVSSRIQAVSPGNNWRKVVVVVMLAVVSTTMVMLLLLLLFWLKRRYSFFFFGSVIVGGEVGGKVMALPL